ncbi:MAG: hypothetical protein AB7E96_11915 [Deferribacterales bacterium]
MRKLLVALMMVAFAATAFAADVKFGGTYEFDGKYVSNYNGNGLTGDDDSVSGGFYEHDLDLWMQVNTDKDTFFKTKLELLDRTITGESGSDTAYKANTDFSVQRAWIGHNFGAVQIEAGLMDSGAWGYAFADDAEGSYRVKATIPVAGGKLSILTQKKAEEFNTGVEDSEKDDADKYSIGYKGTFGGIMVAPKLDYDINSNKDATIGGYDGKDNKVINFDLAVGGKFGALSVETEFQYIATTFADEVEGSREDFNVYGIYANVGYKVGAATIGFLTAYGSVSDDMPTKGFDFKDDFDSTFILGDDMGVGGEGWTTGDQGGDLSGWWANALYALYDVNDKLSLMAKFAYATSNWDEDGVENAVLDGATAWEFDASATYAITKELSYYVNFGYAKVDLDVDGYDIDDPIMLVKHGLVLSF